MSIGPIQAFVIGFPDSDLFEGRIADELARWSDVGQIRIIDASFVTRDGDDVTALSVSDLSVEDHTSGPRLCADPRLERRRHGRRLRQPDASRTDDRRRTAHRRRPGLPRGGRSAHRRAGAATARRARRRPRRAHRPPRRLVRRDRRPRLLPATRRRRRQRRRRTPLRHRIDHRHPPPTSTTKT